MTKRTFLLTWIVLSTLIVIGDPASRVVFAIPSARECPSSPNSACPTCKTVMVGAMFVYCHQTATPFKVCRPVVSGSCSGTAPQPCSGVHNTMHDCSGMDLSLTCNSVQFSCWY